MLWPMLAVALGFCGIAVLAVLAVRVALEVRRLARQVRDSSQRLAQAAENLERAAVPLAATSGTLHRDRGPGEPAGAQGPSNSATAGGTLRCGGQTSEA